MVWVGVYALVCVPLRKRKWEHDRGAGSGLKFSGWPHVQPNKEPFRQGEACGFHRGRPVSKPPHQRSEILGAPWEGTEVPL